MFDTMTMTKVVGAGCGSLLVFMLGGWVAETIYHSGGAQAVESQSYVIDTGADEMPADAVDAGPSFEEVFASADAAAGERAWAKCRACHKLDGTDGTGPHLDGIVNKAKAASDGYAYSPVLAGMAGDVWSPENLDAFIQNPRGYAPGTKMSFAGIPRAQERADLIAYLATQN